MKNTAGSAHLLFIPHHSHLCLSSPLSHTEINQCHQWRVFLVAALPRCVHENRKSYLFLNAIFTSSLSPSISTTLQKVRSPRRVKSSPTRLPPMRRLRTFKWPSHSGRVGFTMFNSLRGALGRMPSTEVSSRKTAPEAHACGEHDTGYCTGSSCSRRSMPQNSSGRR